MKDFIIGGLPGTGKSIFLINKAVDLANAGFKVGFFNEEDAEFKVVNLMKNFLNDEGNANLSVMNIVSYNSLKDVDFNLLDYAAFDTFSITDSHLHELKLKFPDLHFVFSRQLPINYWKSSSSDCMNYLEIEYPNAKCYLAVRNDNTDCLELRDKNEVIKFYNKQWIRDIVFGSKVD